MDGGDYLDDEEQFAEFIAQTAQDSRPLAGPSQTYAAPSFADNQERSGPSLIAEMNRLQSDIAACDELIRKHTALRADYKQRYQTLEQQLAAIRVNRHSELSSRTGAPPGATNFMTSSFEWSAKLKQELRRVFDIPSFRLCQEGVCNANMEGRDIVCVMPTGGGKSLTYQLPAIISNGCTLVISPLISLITDQILHLHEFGIEACMMTGATTKEESRSFIRRMLSPSGTKDDLKLCYVTPEKIAKNKTFRTTLQKMAADGTLSRIVIDEAHCVSQMGHDFRHDYRELHVLRTLCPNVPVLALSATCPPTVLEDLCKVLRLKPITHGNAASANGTVYFSAPLYRKNLHYKVVPKPSSAAAAIKAMKDYILTHHRNCSGIVYCFSKNDAENVAKELQKESNGVIRTGVYHSDVKDKAKTDLHTSWREGKINVVVATIAFGMGIDKANVRFVLHHTLSKSLEGFYQESGRAGRDGKDADCVLYYRSQDASRIFALTFSQQEGRSKLHGMLEFAIDRDECRKIAFAKYFESSTGVGLGSWDDSGSITRCGHCDNCTRSPETTSRQDVSLDAWKICKVAEEVEVSAGRVTVAKLADLARGMGKCAFEATKKGRRRSGVETNVTLDLDVVCGGKVTLSKDDTENLIVQLVLSGYLTEDFHQTPYAINVYIKPGRQSFRLTRHSADSVKAGNGERFQMTLVIKPPKAKTTKPRKKKGDTDTADPSSSQPPVRKNRSLAEFVEQKKATTSSSKGKEKAEEIVYESDDGPVAEDDDGDEADWNYLDDVESYADGSIRTEVDDDADVDDDGYDDDELARQPTRTPSGGLGLLGEDEPIGTNSPWSYSLRDDTTSRKKRGRKSGQDSSDDAATVKRPRASRKSRVTVPDEDAILISSD